MQGSRLHGAVEPLLDLRKQGGRGEAGADARAGRKSSVARRAGRGYRRIPDGRYRDSRLLRAAEGVARHRKPERDSGLDDKLVMARAGRRTFLGKSGMLLLIGFAR